MPTMPVYKNRGGEYFSRNKTDGENIFQEGKMKVALTKMIRKRRYDYDDEISVFDNKGRVIVVTRGCIPDLIEALVRVHGFPGPCGVEFCEGDLTLSLSTSAVGPKT